LEVKASGELWWVFQHVDMAVEAVIEGIDGALGSFIICRFIFLTFAILAGLYYSCREETL
jgi:hypothetical protein